MMINKRLIESVKEVKKDIGFNVVFQWTGLLCGIGFSLILAYISQVMIEQSIHQSVFYLLLAAAVLMGTRMFLSYQASQASSRVSRTAKVILRQRMMKKLLDLNSTYSSEHLTSEVVQLCTEGVDQLESYFALYLPQFFYAMLSPITLFCVTCRLNLRASIVLFVCVPLIPFSIALVQKFAKKLLSKYWGKYTALSDLFLENLQGLTTLKVFQSDQRQHEKMNASAEQFRVITMKVLTMQLNSISIMDMVAYGGTALGIYFAVTDYLNHESSLFVAMSIILLSAEFFLPMRQLGSYFHIAMNGMAASERMFSLLDQKLKNQGHFLSLPEGYDISVNNLSYSYSDDHNVLDNIFLEIPQNSFIGIAGPSGSGKSTLAKLLSGKLYADHASIKIGNTHVNDLHSSVMHRLITCIGFQSSLFKGTLKENLLMGNPDASDAMMWDVLDQCRIKDFYDSLDGLDTLIQEGSSNLSAGQRQRTVLARALLHDSPIYLFDEATSSMDSESEEAILNKIHQLKKNKTVIMISHRLANLKQADCIYVLNHGKIEEKGTYEKLMQNHQLFASMAKHQLDLESTTKETNA